MAKSLVEMFKAGGLKQYRTDKGMAEHHNYLEVYDELFKQYRDDEINIFEVGYAWGGSCKLWEEYFPNAHIQAIDIRTIYFPASNRRVKLDLKDVNELTSDYFKGIEPTIAIDDGSHKLEDQLYFVKTVYPVLKQGGLLIVEDIQDIDKQYAEFEKLGIPFEVIDLRQKSNVYDDVLVIFKKQNNVAID